MANRFLNNITVNDSYTLPSSDGTENQIIVTDGAGNLSFNDLGTITGAITGVESDTIYYEVKNSSGSQILKGKGVMAVGTDGNSGHILIDEMVADGSVEPRYFLGVLSETLDNGSLGRVIAFGELDQFNTNGQNGETWTNGQVLWCDPDSAGDFTTTEPDGPNVKIPAAFILKAATNGKIQIRVQANEAIHMLHDTKITTQADGELLVWDNTTGVWMNDGTATIDYTNGRVGIGTTSPAEKLEVNGTIKTSTGLIKGANASAYINLDGTVGSRLRYGNQYLTANASHLVFSTNDNVRMTVTNAGNVGIGTTSPSTKLHIAQAGASSQLTLERTGGGAGKAVLAGAVEGLIVYDDAYGSKMYVGTSGTYNGNVGIGTTSPSARLHVYNTGNGEIEVERASGALVNIQAQSAKGLIGTDSNHTFSLKTNSSERLTILTSGNVGIGTTSPDHLLTLQQKEDAKGIKIYGYDDKSTSFGSLYVDAGGNTKLTQSNPGASGYLQISAQTYLSLEAPGLVYTTSNFRIYDAGLLSMGSGGDYKLKYDNVSDVLNIHTDDNKGITISNTGLLKFTEYGSGTVTGTATQRLAVDSSGNVIEIPIGSGPVDGSGTANYVTKWSDSDTITDSVIYDDGTNVGIGDATPTRKLTVNGDIGVADNGKLFLWDSHDSNYLQYYRWELNSSLTAHINNSGSGGVALKTAGNTRLHINSSGNVGIGTTSPQANLQVGSVTSSVYNLSVGKVDIVDTDKDLSDTQMGTLNLTSTTRTASSPFNQGYGPSITFTQNGSGYVDGYEKVIGGIKTEIKNATNLNYASIMQFYTHNNSSLSPRMTIDGSSGNVGIGTASPSYKLDVSGTSRFSSNGQVLTISGTDHAYHGWQIAGSRKAYAGFAAGGSTDFTLMNEHTGAFVVGTNNSEKMRITSSGNIGIGTTSPNAKLDIKSSSSNSIPFQVTNSSDTDAIFSILEDGGGDGRARIFNAAGTLNVNLDSSGYSYFNGGNVGIGTTSPVAKLNVVNGSSGQSYSNVVGVLIDVNGSSNSYYGLRVGSSTGNDHLCVTNAGNVGIGTTSPAAKLDVNGGIRMADDSSTASSSNVGTLRYRTSGNNSYVDMCMQTGALTYEWINIVQNNW